MLRTPFLVGAVLGLTLPAAAGELEKPVRLTANEKPIDTEIGHAAPFVWDCDGDGKPDLLVGQFGKGRLKLYKNVGSRTKPAFKGFEWFKAGGAIGRVPTG